MRRRLILALACASALASAGNEKKQKPIDPKDKLDKLLAFRDEIGNLYVLPNPDQFTAIDDSTPWVFYGDAKNVYQQRIIGTSSEGNHFEWYVWAPRVKDMQTGAIEIKDGKGHVECARGERRELKPLKADEAKTVFAKLTFNPPLWQRQSRFLARDDDGVYYFVDQLREEFGGNGFRVFVGMKGTMKELPMTNMVSDSKGQIFATKGGQLKIIADTDGKAFWIKGGKKVELTVLEPGDNRYLIYRELGIYGQIGTACDDL